MLYYCIQIKRKKRASTLAVFRPESIETSNRAWTHSFRYKYIFDKTQELYYYYITHPDNFF